MNVGSPFPSIVVNYAVDQSAAVAAGEAAGAIVRGGRRDQSRLLSRRSVIGSGLAVYVTSSCLCGRAEPQTPRQFAASWLSKVT
jgi:hypothetical protein